MTEQKVDTNNTSQFHFIQGSPSIPLETCKQGQLESEILWTHQPSWRLLISLTVNSKYSIHKLFSKYINYLFWKRFLILPSQHLSFYLLMTTFQKNTFAKKHELHFLHLSLSPLNVNIGKLATLN